MITPAGLAAALVARPFAHRGLWRRGGPPENALSAFAAACEAGYGVELDVQLSADGEAVVFHDATLERMTAQAGIVEERPVEELVRLRLMGSDQTIPTLTQALATIAGRTMVLIELKTPPGQEGFLEQRVIELLDGYEGDVALIGFNIASHAWLADHAPDLPRGLNLMKDEQDISPAQPHFLAPSLEMAASDSVRRWRAGGLKTVAWTVRLPAEQDALVHDADNIIFEGLRP